MEKFKAEIEFENKTLQKRNEECVKVNKRQKLYKQVINRLGGTHSFIKI